MSVRLYGRVVGHGSFAQVTAGFAQVLRGADQLAGLRPIDQDQLDDDEVIPGATAPYALTVGPPAAAVLMERATRHTRRAVMLAPNSTALPKAILKMLGQVCTEILTPSGWGKTVIERYATLPVHVVPHGVFPAFVVHPAFRQRVSEVYQAGEFAVAHFATGDRERKGTRELLQAWLGLLGDRKLPDAARLVLIVDVEAAGRLLTWLGDQGATERQIESIIVRTRLDLGPEPMARLLSQFHLVCQPSRGEGYGMVPTEALAAGVPICATRCTGHSEWYTEHLGGAWPIEHGPERPIDDFPEATAPAVEPDAIAAALVEAYQLWPGLQAEALQFAPLRQAQWSWEQQLAPWMASIEFHRKVGL